ncbi:MAG: membrane protein insertase YidC [Nitrospirae bacterium]|nr:membrane protein insertase YidC [Nitrospirota bacterium]
MEKRTLLAIALSILVLVAYSYFFQPSPVQKQAAPTLAKQAASEIKPQEAKQALPSVQLPVPAETKGQDIIIETDLYKAVFTTEGAVIKSWELKKYKNKNGMPVSLLSQSKGIPPLAILLEGKDRDLPQKLIYRADSNNLLLAGKGDAKGELTFLYEQEGMLISKKLVFYNNDYKVDLSLNTVNVPAYLLAVGTDFGVFDKEENVHKGPVVLIDSDRSEFDEKLKESKNFTGNIYWIAQEDKYFTAALVPRALPLGASVWKEGDVPQISIKPNQQKQDILLYAGPKEFDRLKALNLKLEHIIDFGWFSIVAMPLFWALKLMYKFIGNYGWVIILVTVIIRIPFIPLMHKSQKTMKKMQELQPRMAEIREKYKKDPQKMQKELMELYKKNKVNPMGGCLPMLLQIPVFIALYNVLLKAIELRGAPFAFWITDLAAKDPYYALPIAMGITMVIQQKMTPSTMDPTQAKIMMFLPIVFTFMFLNFPSGLVIYWLMNNILGIAQQYFVNKSVAAKA